MRWAIATAVVLAGVALAAGCGTGGTTVTPPPPTQVVGSFLADGFTPTSLPDPVANLGFVVRADRGVAGAVFFTINSVDYDAFITGAVDASNNLQATGRLMGNSGTQDLGQVTFQGTFGSFPLSGANIEGTFTAAAIVTNGSWRGFVNTVPLLGTYMGAVVDASQQSKGAVAIMNFQIQDTVMMVQDAISVPGGRIDFFASAAPIANMTLTPPATPGGNYTLAASNGLYGTGFSFNGSLGALTASGTWQQVQPAPAPILTGTWSATTETARAAAGRGRAVGPVRLYRTR